VTETSCSRRTATIASILFLLVLLPAHSQIPSPSPTSSRRNPEMFNAYPTRPSRIDFFASPTPPMRPQRTYNIASPTPLARPPRAYNAASATPPLRLPRPYNIASPTPPTRPTRTYNAASPTPMTPPTRPPRMYNAPSPTPPKRPPRTYNTATPVTPTPLQHTEDTTSEVTATRPPRRYTPSPITATPPPRRYDTPSPATPTPPPSMDNSGNSRIPTRPPPVNITASPTIPSRPSVPDITPSPIRRFPFPVPNIAASSTIPPWMPPRRDYTARPPQTPFRRLTSTPTSSRDVAASPTVSTPIDITAILANRVILNATPSTVEIDQKVRFELRFQRPPPPVPNIQYGFNFADGSPIEWTAAPRTTHSYSAGGTYEPSVEVRVGERVLDLPRIAGPTVQVAPQPSPTPSSTATSTPITPSPSPYTPSPTALPTATPPISPPPEVRLSVDKNPISSGDSVTFSIVTNLPAGNQPHSYSVDFGDGSQPIRITSNSVSHVFKAPGHYTVSVALLNEGSHAHADLAISVDARRTSRLWVYILAALAVVTLAYLVFQRSKLNIPMAAHPTFHPHSDLDAPQTSPKNLAINYGLYFHPNVSAGQDRLENDEPGSILRKKK